MSAAAIAYLPSHRLTANWSLIFRLYVALHGLWLVLYALLGKGFAYAGVAPFYAGEFLLLFAIPTLICSGRTSSLVRSQLGVLFGVFFLWQILCAVPHLEVYGIDTLRDSAIWAYAVFAWVSAAMVLRLPGLLRTMLHYFGRFGRWFLVVGPLAWIVTLYYQDRLPHWGNSSVSIPYVKGGEFCVHLAGIFAYAAAELWNRSQWWMVLILADSLLGMRVRGGLLAFIIASLFVMTLTPRFGRTAVLLAAGLMLIVMMATFDIRFTYPGTNREFSVQHLYESIASVFQSEDHGELENTKAWRIAWWNRIWDYTVEGPYFWMGKGYGINLADSDGFQVGTPDEPLRSPHNSHLTLLARSGVPGFALWLALQGTWLLMMLRGYIKAKTLRSREWSALFVWLAAYWIAFVVCAAFDVFLEGPMAGIPFWTLFGIGWGSYMLFFRQLDRRPRETWSHA